MTRCGGKLDVKHSTTWAQSMDKRIALQKLTYKTWVQHCTPQNKADTDLDMSKQTSMSVPNRSVNISVPVSSHAWEQWSQFRQ